MSEVQGQYKNKNMHEFACFKNTEYHVIETPRFGFGLDQYLYIKKVKSMCVFY